MDSSLLDLLVCPGCKGPLHWNRAAGTLDCEAEQLAYPIVDGIPVLLVDAAIDSSARAAGPAAGHAPGPDGAPASAPTGRAP